MQFARSLARFHPLHTYLVPLRACSFIGVYAAGERKMRVITDDDDTDGPLVHFRRRKGR